MHLNKGDKVKFLNDTGGGIITGLNNPKVAMVLIDDGFEVPVPVSELILVEKAPDKESSGEKETSRKDVFQKKVNTTFETDYNPIGKPDMDSGSEQSENQENQVYERNLLFAFVENAGTDELEIWLINDSAFNVYYVVLQKQDDLFRNIKTGLIEADTKIFVEAFTRDQVNSFFSLRLQALFFRNGMFDPLPPSQKEYALNPSDIFALGSFTMNDFFDKKAKIVPMISDSHEREVRKSSEEEVNRLIARDKESAKPDRQKPAGADSMLEEVDLHIEELIDDHSALSGREVLDIQMARFATALEGAIRGTTKRIVFIHGIGNGKLKYEIRKTLDKKYPKLIYQDASFKEYGYGATMVIVRR